MLKKSVEKANRVTKMLPLMDDEVNIVLEPTAILTGRLAKKNSSAVSQVLVH